MKITNEISLSNFDFWGGAKYTVEYLTAEELDTIENTLESEYPNGIDETELNDLFRFEEDTIAEWLGYKNFDEIRDRDETIDNDGE